MKDKLSSMTESVRAFWNRTSKKMRIVYLVGAVAILGVSLAIVLILNNTNYIVLYDGLSSTDNATVIASLTEMGVPFVLEGNKLMIPDDQELNVRMQLASSGYTNSGFDYATFQNGSSITATQYEKEKYAVFQLQERLQSTIMTFPEVKNAIVTISMPEKNSFVLQEDKTQPKASIKLETVPGRELTTQQIQGILNIVRDSVPGLSDENISISDQTGSLRSVLDSGQQAAANKLSLTEQVNETVRRRVMSMLAPVYGDGKINVAVNTVLDTNQKVTESNTYTPLDPENPTRNPLDYMEIAREKQAGEGFAAGVPGANDNTDVPQYAAQDQELEGADYYSAHDVYDYLVGSVKEQIVKEGLEITDMTVAVIIDAAQLPNGEKDAIIDIVASTAGVAGDKISVQNIPFTVGQQPLSIMDNTETRQLVIAGIVAVVAALIILAIVLMMLANRRKRREALAAEGGYLDDDATLLDLLGQEEEFEPITIPETTEQKLKAQIKDLADSDPEIVAQLIKTWLLGA